MEGRRWRTGSSDSRETDSHIHPSLLLSLILQRKLPAGLRPDADAEPCLRLRLSPAGGIADAACLLVRGQPASGARPSRRAGRARTAGAPGNGAAVERPVELLLAASPGGLRRRPAAAVPGYASLCPPDALDRG